ESAKETGSQRRLISVGGHGRHPPHRLTYRLVGWPHRYIQQKLAPCSSATSPHETEMARDPIGKLHVARSRRPARSLCINSGAVERLPFNSSHGVPGGADAPGWSASVAISAPLHSRSLQRAPQRDRRRRP